MFFIKRLPNSIEYICHSNSSDYTDVNIQVFPNYNANGVVYNPVLDSITDRISDEDGTNMGLYGVIFTSFGNVNRTYTVCDGPLHHISVTNGTGFCIEPISGTSIYIYMEGNKFYIKRDGVIIYETLRPDTIISP